MSQQENDDIVFDRSSEEVVKMLDGLAEASAELENISKLLSDHLTEIGSRLRNTLQNEIRLSRRRVTAYVTTNVAASEQDKNKILRELSAYRRHEIASLIEDSQAVKERLRNETNTFIQECSEKVNDGLEGLQAVVADLKVDDLVEQGRKQLSSASARAAQQIDESVGQSLKQLPELSTQRIAVVESVSAGLNVTAAKSLSMLLGKFHEDLEGISKEIVGDIEKQFADYRLRFAEQQALLDDSRRSLPDKFQKVWEKEKIAEYFTDLVKSFDESVENFCEIQAGSYQVQLQRLAQQSKEQVQRKTKYAGGQMVALQADFIASAVEQQRLAWDRCEQLMSVLESAVEAEVNADTEVAAGARAALKKIAGEFRGKTAKKARHMEMFFDKTAESILLQIESLRNEACELLESEVAVGRRDIAEIQEDIEKRLADLQKQTIKIERSGMKVSGVIAAFRKSSISFQQEDDN